MDRFSCCSNAGSIFTFFDKNFVDSFAVIHNPILSQFLSSWTSLFTESAGPYPTMDPSLGFAQLLGLAQDNQADKTISRAQLARKREQKREKGKIAPNVKKFLEKKEVEERRKRIEKKLELEKLNEARSAANKNKINKHLKVTFGGSKEGTSLGVLYYVARRNVLFWFLFCIVLRLHKNLQILKTC